MRNNLARGNATRFCYCCAVALVMVFAVQSVNAGNPQISGAVYTTFPSTQAGCTGQACPEAYDPNTNTFATVASWIVNENIYPDKPSVFFNGGPRNTNFAGLPDGTYYFEVTAPRGNGNDVDCSNVGGTPTCVLLSADPARCRKVDVVNGRIVAWDPSGSCPATHLFGLPDPPANGGVPVQLCPAGDRAGAGFGAAVDPPGAYDPTNWCDSTPNPGGEYKAWLVLDSAATPTDASGTANADGQFLTFNHDKSKTDNFKVVPEPTDPCLQPGASCPVLWPISGIKFYDTNGDGIQNCPADVTGTTCDGSDAAHTLEPGIPGWQIVLYSSPSTSPSISGFAMSTDGGGLFNTDNNPTADKPVAGGVYGVCETVPTSANANFAWTKTAACPKSYLATTVPPDFAYGGTFTDGIAGHTDVAFTNGTDYSLQYPVTATEALTGSPHLGIPYANCGPGYYNNIDDVFERTTGSATYPVAFNGFPVTFNDVPGSTGLPIFQTASLDSWNGTYPGAVFGNRCVNTPGGGLTIGFWSNKNGASILGTSTGSAYVDGLKDPSNSSTPLHFVGPVLADTCTGSGATLSCLAGSKTTWNAGYLPVFGTAGTPFTGTLVCSISANTCFDTWLTNGSNSANASNQLSVQMTGAVLNINKGAATIAGKFVLGPALTTGTYVYAAGSNCAAAAGLGGYATLGCVITEANTVLGMLQSDNKYAWTPSGSTATCAVGGALGTVNCRTYETTLQSILNNVNNNVAGPAPGPGPGITFCGVNYANVNACTLPKQPGI